MHRPHCRGGGGRGLLVEKGYHLQLVAVVVVVVVVVVVAMLHCRSRH